MARRVALVALCALACAGTARAAGTTYSFTTTASVPVYDAHGHLIQTPFAPTAQQGRLGKKQVLAIFLRDPKVAHWLERYPTSGRVDEEDYNSKDQSWKVQLWWGKAGEIATGRVDDTSGTVLEAWTGPQVAWKMARGYRGAFGGTKINDPWIWGAFCLVFLLGLADLRRPWSIRNLDLLAMLGFTLSLWYFNKGNIFTSVPLAYPPLVYLIARGIWIGVTGRATRFRPVWPVWALLAATVFLVGFRIGLNVQESNVIDVGYSGVIGAERIFKEGESPYGHFPIEGSLKACGPADAEGEIRERIQTNGRCESANPQGDTYGPVAYLAYGPGYYSEGWSGKWDDLPAAHFTTLLFDCLCIIGLGLAGRRFGGAHLAATLMFAWAAYPFTQYASNSNTNDMILPAFLIWGFWLAASPFGRGIFGALAGWTKFAALVVAPLWLTYPDRRPKPAYLAGFAVATLVSFSVLLLEPSLLHAARVFWDRTVGWQLGSQSPFSLWDWRQYHAKGIPDLHWVQRILEGLLVAGSLAVMFFPRRKSPLQLAALTAALLGAFELVLTHWFYLYIPWFFAFSAFAALAPGRPAPARVPVRVPDADIPELAPAR